LQLVSRDARAGGARLAPPRPVREVDVQHLGRAEAFDNVVARKATPGRRDLVRQYLRGGDREAQAGEIRSLRLGRGGEGGIKRRQAEEDGGPVLRDRAKDRAGLRPPG